MSWAWKLELPATDKYTLIALADHANDEDFTCYPSLNHLAKKTGLDRSTIWKTIDRLIAAGLVNRLGESERGSTLYRVNVGRCVEHLGAQDTQVHTAPRVGAHGNRVGAQDTSNHHESSLNHQKHIPRKREKPRIPMPDTMPITDGMRKWAESKTPNVDLETETANFLDHHRSKGNKFVDLEAAWRTWMRNSQKWARPGGKHETHQPIDNSAPARVRRAYEQREREALTTVERVD